MKVFISLWILLSISLSSFAQQGINYKAIIKDTNGNILATEFMNVQFTIHETSPTGTIVYQEDYNYTTDTNGMIILNIGSDPTPSIGAFEDINWSADIHFLQMTITYSEGTIDFDATQFMAVPYALSSMDNLWQRNENNAIAVTEKVGVGTDTPSQLLSLNNPDNASIQLETATFSDTTGIRFENGQKTGEHTFFKIENTSDNLRISVDSDFTPATDYDEVLRISTNGTLTTDGSIDTSGNIFVDGGVFADGILSIQNGTSINEFSIDGSLAGNSNNAVPTEAAVKTYVDNNTEFTTIDLDGELNASNTGNANMIPLAYGTVDSNGDIVTGTGNFVVLLVSNVFRIDFNNNESLSYSNTVCLITPISTVARTSSTTISDSDLNVRFFNADGAPVLTTFQFVIYKL